jgi:nucleoid-associated protein Lsr2
MRKTKILLVDDLDGSEAAETVPFGLDGASYEIDLSEANAGELRKTLAAYTQAGRRAPSSRGRGRNRRPRNGTAEIRAWAKTQGITIKDRGRIPAEVEDKYHAAVPSAKFSG